jgi:hypothetical protein
MGKTVSEYRKELLKSAIVAIMSASLLGAATYYLVQPGYRPISVAFALVEGRQFSGNCSVAFGCWLDLNFTFLNGSVITKSPLPPLEELCLGKPIPDEYSGEFNATELQKITVVVHGFSGFYLHGKSILKVLVACLEDRIINVTMLDQEMTDLGSSKSFGGIWGTSTSRDGGAPGEPYIENKTELDELKSSFNVAGKALESSTGYWKTTDYIWEITTNQLGDMLRESGTANITFTMDINMGLKYKITTTSEGNLTGDATLSWSGRWGTLQLTHEEGNISCVKYNFITVKLIMLVTE